MERNALNIKQVLAIAGSFIAFLIGSGFSTGQETMQYYVAYGFKGVAGAAVVFLLLAYVGTSFILAGYRERFEKPSDVFEYYCGKIIGKFYDYFAVFFVYLCFMIMVAGAGATINQQYGLPVSLGGIGLGLLAGLTVIFGFNRMVDIIGKIGPTLVVLTIVLGLTAIMMSSTGLTEANRAVADMDLLKISGNWFYSALSYAGLCIIWLAPFMSRMGAGTANKKTASSGAVLGAFGFALGIIVLTLGLLANIHEVKGSQVPSLIIAGNIHPGIATLFSLLVVLAIYSTAVPLLWSSTSRIADEKTVKFKYVTISMTIIGTLVGLYIPFDRLVNIVFILNGYIGFILVGFMIIKDIRNIINKRKQKSYEQLVRKAK